MCVYVCMRVSAILFEFVCVYVCDLCMCVSLCMYLCVCVCTFVCVCDSVCICTGMSLCMFACV